MEGRRLLISDDRAKVIELVGTTSEGTVLVLVPISTAWWEHPPGLLPR